MVSKSVAWGCECTSKNKDRVNASQVGVWVCKYKGATVLNHSLEGPCIRQKNRVDGTEARLTGEDDLGLPTISLLPEAPQ